MDKDTAGDAALVLSFARQLGESKDKGAEAVAKERGWLDEDGKVTGEGYKLIESLDGQGGTRSVFRQY